MVPSTMRFIIPISEDTSLGMAVVFEAVTWKIYRAQPHLPLSVQVL